MAKVLIKTIRQAEKVFPVGYGKIFNSPCIARKKSDNFRNVKNAKITKLSHAFKGYTSLYNVEILNSFNSELKLKDTESEIKNKLIDLLNESKSFCWITESVIDHIINISKYNPLDGGSYKKSL